MSADTPLLYPKEIIEYTAEAYEGRRKPRGSLLYLVLICLFPSLVIAATLLSFSVSVKAVGLIHALTETSRIKSPASGYIKKIFIGENSRVKKGDAMFHIYSPSTDEKIDEIVRKQKENTLFITDLKKLLEQQADGRDPDTKVHTGLYRQEWITFIQRVKEKEQKIIKVSRDYERNKKLFIESVIAATDFENFEFELTKARTEKNLIMEAQRNSWVHDLLALEKENSDLKHQRAVLATERDNAIVYSPVNGTIQNLAGIYEGSSVFTNQDLAEISPDTTLVAEVYVSPSDIGLLRKKMQASIQVNAFNYNQWGLLSGNITEISDDIFIKGEQPFFKIKCTLIKDHLSLANGYKGMLRKGMTVTCRFLVIRRTLWQLLYDKTDNWINPGVTAKI